MGLSKPETTETRKCYHILQNPYVIWGLKAIYDNKWKPDFCPYSLKGNSLSLSFFLRPLFRPRRKHALHSSPSPQYIDLEVNSAQNTPCPFTSKCWSLGVILRRGWTQKINQRSGSLTVCKKQEAREGRVSQLWKVEGIESFWISRVSCMWDMQVKCG